MNGIEIIQEYESDPWMSSEIDIIYVGKANGKAINKISRDDDEIMRSNGWRKSHVFQCWCFKLV